MSDLKPASHQYDFLADVVHVFCLSSLAFAQPLYDVLSRGAEFFVARQSRPLDIALLTILISFLLPASIVGMQCIFGLLGKLYRKLLHYAFVAIATTIFFLPSTKKFGVLPDAAMVSAAGLIGAVAAWAYVRFQPMRGRSFLTILSVITVLFPAFFLFGSRVSGLVITDTPTAPGGLKLKTSTPIILVVFDELSTTALLDGGQMIDRIRYPNLAALAHQSTWFRNATTVSDFTTIAIPALLTGRYPSMHDLRLPTAADHPANMFELFSRSHEMIVFEARTSMHNGSRSQTEPQGLPQRLSALLSDTALVYLHIIATPALGRRLPTVTQDWGNFKPTEQPATTTREQPESSEKPEDFQHWFRNLVKAKPFNQPQDRDYQFQEFLTALDAPEAPSFHFIHSLFPHIPYDHLPSGKIYNPDARLEGLISERWVDNDRLVTQAHLRYLLQVRFVDKLVGQLVDRLKSTGLYDRSLIILTSDHGASFRPGDARRKITATNFCDIMRVPLLIKTPHQSDGIVEDINIETVDILPTVADILKIDLPWTTDGHSVVSKNYPGKSEKTFFSGQVAEKERLTFQAAMGGECSNLDRQLERFGSHDDDLFSFGPFKELIGRDVSEFDLSQAAASRVELSHPALYQDVRLDSSYIPAMITGRLITDDALTAANPLAISVNGIIQRIVDTDSRDGGRHFSALVPETSFASGRNSLAFFAVSRVEESVRLNRFPNAPDVSYSLSREHPKGEEIIKSSSGDAVNLVRHALNGHLNSAKFDGDFLQITGWAADLSHSRLPHSILVFVDGHMKYQAPTNRERPDLVKAYKAEAIRNAGFQFTLPRWHIGNPAESEVRVFALSEDHRATEIVYFTGYKWGRRFELGISKDGQEEEVLIELDGGQIPIVVESIKGAVFAPRLKGQRLILSGWAADVAGHKEPEAIVFFLNGKFLYCGQVNLQREQIRKKFDDDAFLWSGFHYGFPSHLFDDLDNSKIQVFAISSRGIAAELGQLEKLVEASGNAN